MRNVILKFAKFILKLLSFIIPTEVDLTKSKYSILSLLFTYENQSISTEESIKLFLEVQGDFESELKKRYLESQMEVSRIDDYFRDKELKNNN